MASRNKQPLIIRSSWVAAWICAFLCFWIGVTICSSWALRALFILLIVLYWVSSFDYTTVESYLRSYEYNELLLKFKPIALLYTWRWIAQAFWISWVITIGILTKDNAGNDDPQCVTSFDNGSAWILLIAILLSLRSYITHILLKVLTDAKRDLQNETYIIGKLDIINVLLPLDLFILVPLFIFGGIDVLDLINDKYNGDDYDNDPLMDEAEYIAFGGVLCVIFLVSFIDLVVLSCKTTNIYRSYDSRSEMNIILYRYKTSFQSNMAVYHGYGRHAGTQDLLNDYDLIVPLSQQGQRQGQGNGRGLATFTDLYIGTGGDSTNTDATYALSKDTLNNTITSPDDEDYDAPLLGSSSNIVETTARNHASSKQRKYKYKRKRRKRRKCGCCFLCFSFLFFCFVFVLFSADRCDFFCFVLLLCKDSVCILSDFIFYCVSLTI